MRSIIFWLAALIITIATAYYQRTTGPTYPISKTIKINDSELKYTLERTHSGMTDHKIKIPSIGERVTGKLIWKRFKTSDKLDTLAMTKEGEFLVASLPGQPSAGKLEYHVILYSEQQEFDLNNGNPVVIRFKGEVPMFVLIPHVIIMFAGMLLSMRTGFEVFMQKPRFTLYTIWTLVLLFLGGFILGPITQYYAFGAFWTGFPFGTDLTDNKTLIAFIGWLIALFAIQRKLKPKGWVIFASVLLIIVYFIPHSLLGSELDYEEYDKQKSAEEKIID